MKERKKIERQRDSFRIEREKKGSWNQEWRKKKPERELNPKWQSSLTSR